MDLIIQHFEGQAFVSNPYAPGTSLRQDLFERQFTITLHGSMERFDESGRGTFHINGHVQLAQCGLLDDILPIALEAIRQDRYPTPVAVLDFHPRRICVSDRHGHLVMAGKVDRESRSIHWIDPCRTAEEEKVVLAQIQLLRSRSAFQHGWENFSTSRLLDTDADLLKGRLVHKAWRPHVRALLSA
ncbi:hypothetical protein BGI51_22125 [Pseudomonas oryzihabitans]|uniref:hypothetical protein n=1 Tax=Pseudomonas oryzihabitans TaxID=47885 RepID=UPI00165D93C0|nr:hypothetical protein [Pseudomonas psychrotolerans]QNR00119.1 hypothetical protein BGI51_22125 [Pseudomonas psychrotolerans]